MPEHSEAELLGRNWDSEKLSDLLKGRELNSERAKSRIQFFCLNSLSTILIMLSAIHKMDP